MLTELFLSNHKDDKEVFAKDLDQIISEVPNKIASKENFWIYFFLGSILTISDTKLQQNLKIQKVEIKLNPDQKILNLRVTIKDKVIFRSVKTEGKCPIIEYEDLSSESEFIEISKISANLDLYKMEIEFLKTLFENLIKIYNHYKDQGLQLKQKPEALHQAFIYGFFKMNTDIECFTEFNAGLGTADLVLKDKGNLIIVECKAGTKTAEDAVEQIKSKGYFHLGILNKFKSAFLVGVNFNQEEGEDLMVEKHEIYKPEGLINILMDDEVEELEEEIKKELEFLCYTKNIGICNPDNPSNKNEHDPENKYVGSFTALMLGQMLQYCVQNEEYKFERIYIDKSKTGKKQCTELAINDNNNKLQFNITEFADKGGNIASPRNNESYSDGSSSSGAEYSSDGDIRYNIEVEVTKDNSNKFTYRIEFPDEGCDKVNVYLHKRSHGSTQSDDGAIQTDDLPSSQGSSKSICVDIDVEKIRDINLMEEIKNGEIGDLKRILEIFKDFIHSEAILQLLLKGIFMNAGIDDGQTVIETEVSTGQAGEIDLLVKFPDGRGIVFECKFCEKVKEVESNKEKAWNQLKRYTNKGNLKYILDREKPCLVSIVYCKESAECIVETQTFEENNLKVLNDSGFVSCEDLSAVPSTHLTQNASLISLNSTPQSSPSMKRKAFSP